MNILARLSIVLLLGIIPLYAQKRASIALVLSGGGARGGAHVGVLKVLEEKKIPIDFIVGTSMGSFVGGLYASGKSPQAIESLLTKTDWTKYIRTDYKRENTPMRKKETEYRYQGRLGLGVDVDNNIVLPTGVLKRQPMLLKFEEEFEHVDSIKDFDRLAIPFRAVATNIENGEAVVLRHGSLANAIYASSSIPGGFQPIKIDGVDLVDGGVSDNMPIGVAKEMGADIIIAVDVSEGFEENLNVNSYFVVMGQLVNILMRKNANESIASLNEKDILITPNLKGFTGLDADKYEKIIQRGVQSTNDVYEKELKHLSLSEFEYERHKRGTRFLQRNKKNIIDAIKIHNPTYISDDIILAKLYAQVGDSLDKKRLRQDILDMYNTGVFDRIEHTFTHKDGKNILEIRTTPSWDNHGEIRFALGSEDDFHGRSTYALKFGYTMFGINEYGAEWKNDFEIGRKELVYSEFYQPLNSRQKLFLKPYIVYKNTNELIQGKELAVQRYGGGLNFGTHIFAYSEFEIGVAGYQDSIDASLFSNNTSNDSRSLSMKLIVDNLDSLNFPNTGIKAKATWTQELESLGSEYDYQQFYVDIEKPLNFGAHNFTSYLKYGVTFEQEGETSFASLYTLGGLFNLSGFAPYSLVNENVALGIIKYRYEIKNGGFFGSLNAPLYAGFSAEVGNTWSNQESLSYRMMYKSGSIYLAADTIFGPFYFAYGFSQSGNKTAYLYLGEKF